MLFVRFLWPLLAMIEILTKDLHLYLLYLLERFYKTRVYDIDSYHKAANAKSIVKKIKVDWMTHTSWHCNQNESIVIHLMTVSSRQICFQSQFTASSLLYSQIFVLVFVWSTLVLYIAATHILDNAVKNSLEEIAEIAGRPFLFYSLLSSHYQGEKSTKWLWHNVYLLNIVSSQVF